MECPHFYVYSDNLKFKKNDQPSFEKEIVRLAKPLIDHIAQDFSGLALLRFWMGNSLLLAAVLHTVGCLAIALASIH